ncbi:MAG: dicarboxylate/amino acid:cation symporter [Prolixibacteraceae bacterium]|nr:dicarboxylate/amino acid:cation symporter [Prolixibacteraceae bacterium]MBN2649116.1 dicarboxylate/amino acid:cation symporter [Prolixibacteraceae bacterium]
MKRVALHWQILVALVLSIPLGIFFGSEGLIDLSGVFSFMGSIFLNALKMIVVPLIISAIITGVSNISSEKGFARMGLKTILYYLFTSFIAILTGLVLVNIFKPGIISGVPAREVLALSSLTAEQMSALEGKGTNEIFTIFLRMVPPNIFKAASEGQMLGLITFSLIFGFFIRKLSENYKSVQLNFWNGVYDIMLGITNLVMRIAPLGVLGLVALTVSQTGFDSIMPLLKFALIVIAALLFHVFVSTSLMLYSLGKMKPLFYMKAMSKALLTAFSTSSSSATLPETIEGVTQVGVPKRVSSFVLPLGATINMDGTALYECVAAMFIAQAYGLDISFGMQLTIVLVALLTSIGVAGVPSASLVAIVIILKAIGLPDTALGLILVVDRPLDMLRTAVNVWSDSCGAAIISASENSQSNN